MYFFCSGVPLKIHNSPKGYLHMVWGSRQDLLNMQRFYNYITKVIPGGERQWVQLKFYRESKFQHLTSAVWISGSINYLTCELYSAFIHFHHILSFRCWNLWQVHFDLNTSCPLSTFPNFSAHLCMWKKCMWFARLVGIYKCFWRELLTV